MRIRNRIIVTLNVWEGLILEGSDSPVASELLSNSTFVCQILVAFPSKTPWNTRNNWRFRFRQHLWSCHVEWFHALAFQLAGVVFSSSCTRSAAIFPSAWAARASIHLSSLPYLRLLEVALFSCMSVLLRKM